MKFSASMKIILFVVRISKIQKKSFADVLQNRCPWKFCNVYRKHLCWSLFLINMQAWRPVTFLKRDLNMCFPVKFAKFLRTPYLQNTFGDCFWKYLMNSLFIAFGNDEWCHFVVRIGSLALISFDDVRFVSL